MQACVGLMRTDDLRCFIFFFSSRRRHTRLQGDWSSDVCSSDLEMTDAGLMEVPNPSALFLAERHSEVSGATVFAGMEGSRPILVEIQALLSPSPRSEERRVGKECRSRWSPYH